MSAIKEEDMKKYRFGVLGLSMGSMWVEGIMRNPAAELAAVYDPNMEHSNALMARRKITLPSPEVVKSSENEFFKTDMDVVVVATPDHLHVPQSVRAMRRGCHVICEKPMAPTVADCKKIIEAAKKTRRWFMTGQVGRYTPGFRAAKQLIGEGTIGNIVFIESEYYHNYANAGGVGNWRSDPKIRREGFIGGGCHALDLLRWLAGNPLEVHCYMNHKYLPTWPTNDTGVAIFKMPNNVIGKVFVSIGVKAGYSMRTVIHGTEGSIICDNTSNSLTLFNAKYQKTGIPGMGRDWKVPVTVNNHNVAAEVDEFVKCLQSGKRPPTDEYEGANTVAFGEAALTSARTGRPVKVKSLSR
jgi:predicted dehydrogenase